MREQGEGGFRVLVVDDDVAMRLLERESLEQAGFAVEEAGDGLEALASFERLRPDIVLLDVMMPRTDGFTVCAEIRKMPHGELTPILMVTGLDDIDSISRAYEVGATDFIAKPINWALLGHHVRYMLRASITFEELRKSEEALRKSEERYALAAQGANDGLWDWDIKTGELYYSPRWKSMLGWEEGEIGKNLEEWFRRVHPEDIEQVKLDMSAHLEGVKAYLETEYRMGHRDGTYRWMLTRGVAVRDRQGKAYRLAGSQTDITERKRAEERLLRDAFYDPMTNLANRALLMDRLEHALRRTHRSGDYLFAVLFLDLDRFKVVNDSLGHNVGDELLVETARRLQGCIRSVDTVARLGGDEFVILLEDITSADEATAAAERIQKSLMIPFAIGGSEVYMTCSIGIALSSLDYDRPDDILRDADTAMYRAKTLGKARHELFNETMHAHAVTLLQLESDLRRAVERNEFRLYYQPIVSLETGIVSGVEALIRWKHPTRGLIYPGEFIPLAEENGLIIPIGEWVLRTACIQIKAWHKSGLPSLRVAVNLSARQLRQRNVVEVVADALRQAGLDPRYLELEITESLIMDDPDATAAILLELKALGVHLSLDDFGTGYSSLSHLHRFPIDTLKIDRSFINRMSLKGEHVDIIQTIVALSKKMGIEATAEGVETVDQLTRLREMKCTHGQGYIFAKPAEGTAIETLLKGAHLPADQDPQETQHPLSTSSSRQGSPSFP